MKIALALLPIFIVTLACADDTEIYVSNVSSEVFQPNVLFVFDTSGSMDDDIIAINAYDEQIVYGSSDPSYYYFYKPNYTFLRAVSGSFIDCQKLKDTISAQPDNPTFQGRVAVWHNIRNLWFSLSSYSLIDANNRMECQADSGVHGLNANSTDLYADDGGPYSSNINDEINWIYNRPWIAVSANYHDYRQNTTSALRKKTEIMKDAAKDLIDNFDNLNVGLMRFNGSNGGYVVSHFNDITLPANKTALKTVIDALPASGPTPLAETLWEASRYFRGDPIRYGGSSVPAAVTNGNYNSPMTHSCQKNHIVYLTDGQPYLDSGSDSLISALGTTCSHVDFGFLSSETCFDELALWMKNTDHNSLPGKQDITLHAIGFDIALPLLAKAAENGGGEVYNASDSIELKSALNNIILSILTSHNTFTAPAITVSAYNNLQHQDDLYYAIFQPKSTPRWPGNLKRYRITNDAVVKDANNNDAIDPATGYFVGGSRSYWSAATDGHSVSEGGFGEQMSASRNIYTHIGTSLPSILTLPANSLTTNNTLLTNAVMGLDPSAPAAELQELIEWMRGVDAQNNIHNFIADPLHNEPLVVNYGGSETSPDNTIFFANNMGMLHAINADDGSEIFSFIPQELLPNGKRYYEDAPTTAVKVYGLDGQTTVWRKESNDPDKQIEPGDGDHVYLYVGMRRGGENYYALDVTNRSNPVLMWQITGGTGQYADLTQTWSKPTLTAVKWNCDSAGKNCTKKPVLIFSGGYDTVHDTATSETTNDRGAAVFMVDAANGNLLWSAGRPKIPSLHDLELIDMQNSIPADVTLADTNDDGFSDIMFTVDITGHIWRFDINSKTTSAANFATGGIIAKLGDYDTNSTNDVANFRRFFNTPDVAFWLPRGQPAFLTISLASGYRAHPKDTTVTDRIYTLFDPNVFNAPASYTGLDSSDTKPLDEGDLFDATLTNADKASTAPFGWYKTLMGTNEKGLSTPTTFGGMLIFTTYSTNNSVICGGVGSGRTYGLNPLTGGGLLTDEQGVSIEYIELVHSGIPPTPTIIFTDDSETNSEGETNQQTKPIVCIGTECFDDLLPDTDPLVRTFWKQER